MNPCWLILGAAAGWVFAPVVLLLGAAVYRLFVPLPSFPKLEYQDPESPLPPPPATDRELRDRMAQARLMRRRQARGLA